MIEIGVLSMIKSPSASSNTSEIKMGMIKDSIDGLDNESIDVRDGEQCLDLIRLLVQHGGPLRKEFASGAIDAFLAKGQLKHALTLFKLMLTTQGTTPVRKTCKNIAERLLGLGETELASAIIGAMTRQQPL